MSMVKIWVILLKRTTPTIKWYTALQIPLFSWENLKRCEVRRLEGRIDNLPVRKKTSVVSPQICTKSLPSYTNLHQVFTKLHQSTPIYTKSWQSYTSLQQSAPIYTKSPSNCATSSPTGSDAHIRVCSCRTRVVAMLIFQFWLMENKLLGGIVCYSSCLGSFSSRCLLLISNSYQPITSHVKDNEHL